jgi:hypothetical protein
MFPHGAADRKSQRQPAAATDLTRQVTLDPPRFMIHQTSPGWRRRRRVRAQAVAVKLIRLPTCGLEFPEWSHLR